jgi:hypothetical protein
MRTERTLRAVKESKCYKRSQHATAQMCILTSITTQPNTENRRVVIKRRGDKSGNGRPLTAEHPVVLWLLNDLVLKLLLICIGLIGEYVSG